MDHFLDLCRDNLGHAHAAVGRIATDTDPAAFRIGAIGLGETGGGADCTFLPLAPFFVAGTVQRRDATGDDLAGLFEDRRGGVHIDGFGQGRQLRPEIGDLEDFIEDELHVTQGGFVVGHGESSSGTTK
ncbi:hypothetical protein D9M71_554640 [compost metagenome]